MMNKKGMQIAISTVVGMILGIMMLIGGLALFFNLMVQTERAHTEIDAQMEEELLRAFQSNEPIFVHVNPVTPARRANEVIFGIGILNIHNTTREFKIDVEPSGELEDLLSEDPLISPMGTFELGARERMAAFVVVPTNNLTRAQHSLTLTVKYEDGDNAGDTYARPRILYIDNT